MINIVITVFIIINTKAIERVTYTTHILDANDFQFT